MGSEGPSVVTVHVTGFKKFHGVSENPTERIASNLKEFMQKNGLPNGLALGSCNVLESAGQGAMSQLYKILESSVVGHDNQSLNGGQIIWLHLGVNSGASRFAVENQAVNEATFRCPALMSLGGSLRDCQLYLLMGSFHEQERLLFLQMKFPSPWPRWDMM